MTEESPRGGWRAGLLLATGVVVGAVATGAVVAVAADLIRGDSPTESKATPSFVEDTGVAGIDQVYDGEFQHFVGGGVAVFDCNADMLPDLFIAGGSEPAGLFVNRSAVGGELRFEQLEAASTDLAGVTGAYPLDVDSDGLTDLAVLTVGENVMLRGKEGCGFEPASETWGVPGGDDWTTAFSARWDHGAQLPTMVFGNYLAGDDQWDGCADHQLFTPSGDRYGDPVTLSPGWCTLSVLFSDWARTGNRDLRTANDRHYYTEGEEQLWRIDPDAPPRLYTESDGWESMQIWGMGIASRDLTGDGRPEVFLTSQGDNKLQTLTGDESQPSYEDIALDLGTTAHRPFIGDVSRPSTAWHAEFGDVNNDGFVDLFVTKGNVEAQEDFAMDDPNNLLVGQADGTFRESAGEAGLLDYSRSRGGALSDLNLDGLLDVVVVERREPVRVWRNTGPGGNWLGVAPRQEPPNPTAVGAWVEVRLGNHVQPAEVTVGGGHAGGEAGPMHFGLGDAESAEIRVIWPDGEVGPWISAAANQVVEIERGVGTFTTLTPMRDSP
jgi:enediyne biosynthesis protein E4